MDQEMKKKNETSSYLEKNFWKTRSLIFECTFRTNWTIKILMEGSKKFDFSIQKCQSFHWVFDVRIWTCSYYINSVRKMMWQDNIITFWTYRSYLLLYKGWKFFSSSHRQELRTTDWNFPRRNNNCRYREKWKKKDVSFECSRSVFMVTHQILTVQSKPVTVWNEGVYLSSWITLEEVFEFHGQSKIWFDDHKQKSWL